jgi:hypothetical protein
LDIMAILRSFSVVSALLIGSGHAAARPWPAGAEHSEAGTEGGPQEVTVSGRVLAQASSLVGNHYVQAYTIDARPDKPLRSVQVSSTDFDAVLIVVSPNGTAEFDDDSGGTGTHGCGSGRGRESG